jgi:hypothetical protein
MLLEYSVIKIMGYRQDKGTMIYFIIDVKDKGSLKCDLIRMGRKWSQDSVLFIPKQTITGRDLIDKPMIYDTLTSDPIHLFNNG